VDPLIFEPFTNGKIFGQERNFTTEKIKKYSRWKFICKIWIRHSFPTEAIRGYSNCFTIANIWSNTEICNGKTKITRPFEKP
jgi:hypothetical protein